MMRYDRAIRMLIRDGAGQFIGGFDDVFRSDGATIIHTPPYTPTNPYLIRRRPPLESVAEPLLGSSERRMRFIERRVARG